MDLDEIKAFVEGSCQSPQNRFGGDFFAQHIEVVRDVALEIGRDYQADGDVVEVAAYLHDLVAVLDPSRVKDHAEQGALFSRDYLGPMGVPEETMEKVAQAIRFHSQPFMTPSHGLEALCVANADVISKVIRLPYWLHYAFAIKKLTFAQGKDWIRTEIVEKAARVDALTRRRYAKEIDVVRGFLTPPGNLDL